MPVSPPAVGRPPSVVINPSSFEALTKAGSIWRGLTAAGGASAIWPTASLSILYPFTVSEPCTAVKMWLLNGTTVAGNFDLGIYDSAGALLVSKGSTAQAGATAIQQVDTTDLALSPAVQYYAALAMDGITATTRCINGGTAPRYQTCGIVQVAANFPLATGVTFAIPANAYMPWFGLSRLVTF